MEKAKRKIDSDTKLAYGLLAPAIILLLVLIGYPMIYNILISFQDVPINPKMPSEIVGFDNYISVLTSKEFYSSLLITILFTFLVVGFSTVIALALSIYLNREFKFKKIVNSIIIFSYVVPSICLIFVWKYMFNSIYGIVNYFVVDVMQFTDTVPLWFDNKVSAFVIVTIFCIWKFFPYAFISFNAILQSIDKTLYEAAQIDGANKWEQFKVITYPCIKPVLITVVTLRTIWVFYIYAEVYLLTKQVNVIGVYLYEMAFSTYDFGKAAAISVILFAFIIGFVMLIKKGGVEVEQ